MTEQVDRELIAAMVSDAVEEAQRRIESKLPPYVIVRGDDEAGTAPTPEQMEEARAFVGDRPIPIIALAYTASDTEAKEIAAAADDLLAE